MIIAVGFKVNNENISVEVLYDNEEFFNKIKEVSDLVKINLEREDL